MSLLTTPHDAWLSFYVKGFPCTSWLLTSSLWINGLTAITPDFSRPGLRAESRVPSVDRLPWVQTSEA
ncbi:hypothetical protein K443DRAFT_681198 [Laccaria amethystina LaAM-08-1]|uniref:Unplaced genomic scaffold K443scaffold_146, whole genome shotgun sequence n=1 Tax=Laccaria amethystina LaAM-08-1 TaxID=1095629 RepID=A0A0C9XK07_9AGAR|nr:hypothetical protein K443DRAFT_681198 [Laccaria amethystina LaAM-08-1]